MAFPKLPDLIPPPPTGPTFDPNAYANLVADTLKPGQAELDGLQNGIDAMRALTVAAELDGVGWVSDFDEIDAALGDIGDIQWGSPEPDFGPVTDYLTARRDEVQTTQNGIGPPPPLAMVYPNGQGALVLGGPPEYGGVVKVGYPQYALHLATVGVGPGVRGVSFVRVDGPNPPFIHANYGVIQETINGRLMYVALVAVNPSTVGTFTGVLYYNVDATITGISGVFTRTLPFQVVVQP